MAGRPTKAQYEKQIIELIGRGPSKQVVPDVVIDLYLKRYGQENFDAFARKLLTKFGIKGNRGVLVRKNKINTPLLNAFIKPKKKAKKK